MLYNIISADPFKGQPACGMYSAPPAVLPLGVCFLVAEVKPERTTNPKGFGRILLISKFATSAAIIMFCFVLVF